MISSCNKVMLRVIVGLFDYPTQQFNANNNWLIPYEHTKSTFNFFSMPHVCEKSKYITKPYCKTFIIVLVILACDRLIAEIHIIL